MLRKLLIGTLLAALTAILVIGAVYRTSFRQTIDTTRGPYAAAGQESAPGAIQGQGPARQSANDGGQAREIRAQDQSQQRGQTEPAITNAPPNNGQGPNGQGLNGQGANGQGPNQAVNQPAYDLARAEVYQATVVGVERNVLTVTTADGAIAQANLGPYWYWSEHSIALQSGDNITFEGIISDATIELNWLETSDSSSRYELRAADGTPLWRR